ncbi:LPS translocon maturation chaperone LptM [Necropsobacter massiliensis]|nr:lipoprotein [Necropsobacter massiliensis]
MKKLISICLLGSLVFLTTGCGVKGPLYFPEKAQAQTQKQ